MPSFVTPAAVRDKVDFVKGNLDKNLAGTFFWSIVLLMWTDASVMLVWIWIRGASVSDPHWSLC